MIFNLIVQAEFQLTAAGKSIPAISELNIDLIRILVYKNWCIRILVIKCHQQGRCKKSFLSESCSNFGFGIENLTNAYKE
jgi:hypothetical protein